MLSTMGYRMMKRSTCLCQISFSIIVLLVFLCDYVSVVTLEGVAQDDGCVAVDGHFHYQVQCDAFHVHEGEE